jgi:menaquinone-dependent protoporphyrinogen oxidase
VKPIGILYATREGHSKRIASYLANALYTRGFGIEVRNVRYDYSAINPANYAGVILAASVHKGEHEPEMVRFVKGHLRQLQCVPAAFLSVTLSQAGVELPCNSAEQRARCAADVQRVLNKFNAQTGWHPKYVVPVAGALLYSKYNVLVRFIMKRIAGKSGGSTDTSCDHPYTNWAALDRFADDFAKELSRVDAERDAAIPSHLSCR